MSLSVTSATGAGFIAPSADTSRATGRHAFIQLKEALAANDMDGAKAAYAAMAANPPPGARLNPEGAFAQLGQALQSGDVAAATGALASMVRPHAKTPPIEPMPPLPMDARTGGNGLVDLIA